MARSIQIKPTSSDPEVTNREDLAEFVRARRTQSQLRIDDAAALCGVSVETLSKIETAEGETMVSPKKAHLHVHHEATHVGEAMDYLRQNTGIWEDPIYGQGFYEQDKTKSRYEFKQRILRGHAESLGFVII